MVREYDIRQKLGLFIGIITFFIFLIDWYEGILQRKDAVYFRTPPIPVCGGVDLPPPPTPRCARLPKNYHHQTKNYQEDKKITVDRWGGFTNGLEVAAEDLKGSPP
ncbi:hypothetical protein AKJ37_07615 [candidate division MSBL1 archaeon SCGC-AAA259I09]|uniref:Uncharacterized protein n=2 Tax=candidate division MSBL1 TaxID=215777 RepID=A0A133URW1_9EURY|nr:hypothetical protein AKJ37_07615 [candidate division MSBL1 archaeon SCGC-AAA259I09]KXA96856.1 hypothetical protein AKJ38_02485 [candidate division MSBL1 archaeon SCGC-AAA259I14]